MNQNNSFLADNVTFFSATQILSGLIFHRLASGMDTSQIEQYVQQDVQVAWSYARGLIQAVGQGQGQSQTQNQTRPFRTASA